MAPSKRGAGRDSAFVPGKRAKHGAEHGAREYMAPSPQQDASKRDAAAGLLARALHAEPQVAFAIEEELHKIHGGASTAYTQAVRSLSFNFKANAALARRVSSGELPPEDVVRLTPAQLASPEAQEQRAKKEAFLLRMSILHDAEGTSTSDYCCPNCKSNACRYMDSMPRDIGKSETWRSSANEGGWRTVTCCTCSHRWEPDMNI